MGHLLEFFKSGLLPVYICLSEGFLGLHSRSVSPDVSYTTLSDDADNYTIVKCERFSHTVYNVYNDKQEMVYTIERSVDVYLQWILYSSPSRTELGRIHVPTKHQDTSFNYKRGVSFRNMERSHIFTCGLPDRTFYLKDGTPHVWVTNSRYLEKIIKTGEGSHEKRVRIAQVTKIILGPKEFVWELSVDPKFNTKIALTTAFISMKTAWCPEV